MVHVEELTGPNIEAIWFLCDPRCPHSAKGVGPA